MPAGWRARNVRRIGASQMTIEELVPSWQTSLMARNLTEASRRHYRRHLRKFTDWLTDPQQNPEQTTVVSSITRQHITRFLAYVLDVQRGAPKSAETYLMALKVFFKWCVEEGEITTAPTAGVKPVVVPETTKPLLSDDELRALLRACEGPDFYARRDMALIRLLIDTGLRRHELAAIEVSGLDLQKREVTVLGKFRRPRTTAFGMKAAAALDRYLRMRARHPDAATSPRLWLGRAGPLTHDGVYNVVRKRAEAAGLAGHVWPHLFRHTFAHNYLAEGGGETALMRLAGWRDRSMLNRYGAALADERARDEARRLQLGDRL